MVFIHSFIPSFIFLCVYRFGTIYIYWNKYMYNITNIYLSVNTYFPFKMHSFWSDKKHVHLSVCLSVKVKCNPSLHNMAQSFHILNFSACFHHPTKCQRCIAAHPLGQLDYHTKVLIIFSARRPTFNQTKVGRILRRRILPSLLFRALTHKLSASRSLIWAQRLFSPCRREQRVRCG